MPELVVTASCVLSITCALFPRNSKGIFLGTPKGIRSVANFPESKAISSSAFKYVKNIFKKKTNNLCAH